MKVINVRVTDKVQLMGIKEGDSILNANFPLRLAEGNYKSVIMNFEFASSTWTEKELTKFATFKINNSQKVQVELTELNGYSNACYVPYDVFQENCKVEVGVYGISKLGGSAEKIVSTEVIKMLIVEGSYNEKLREENDISSSNAEKLEKQINDLTILVNKTVNNIPSKISELENDSNFVNSLTDGLVNYYLKTETYTKDEVKNLINAIKTIQMEVVAELPETGQNNIIYLIARGNQEVSNIYDEYIYVNESWEKIGSTDVDLTNYALKNEIPTKNSQLQNDSGFITGYTETDPTVPNYVKAISEADISNWNNKTDGESIQDIINGGGKTSIKSFDAGIYRFTSFGALGYQKYTGPDGKEYTIYKNDLLMVVKDKSTSTRLSWILMNNSGNMYIGSGKRTISFPFVSNEIADANSTLDGYILTSGNALSKLNTTEYVPTSDYNPTTKKYVDDTIKSKINATFTLDGTTLNINTEA